MNQETWHSLVPNYDIYDTNINNFNELASFSFWSSQKRLAQSLKVFASSHNASQVCLVNAPDNPLYRTLIAEKLRSISDKPVLTTESCDLKTLLGSYVTSQSGELVRYQPGLLKQAKDGIVVIPATLILKNSDNWCLIKAALMQQELSPLNVSGKTLIAEPIIENCTCTIVVVGDRNQLADIDYIEPELLTGLGMFGELETEIALNSQSILSYLEFVRWLINQYQLPLLTHDGLHQLMAAGARYTEDQGYMPLDILWTRTLLSQAAEFVDQSHINAQSIEFALEHQRQRENYLPERALSDILDGQVIIETKGERVGQVNGLTVIDVPGHPLSYGEPARISCVIHFGDGDISDVERKAELGGNLHAKGMMIMQAFVSSALKLDEHLPYSASVVFEQSYCEVDGDSASLAELCSFVSALSEYPINQQIAVTGAVDQFGRVQAVGGLNEKIEGFFRVCQHQGFTGHQGVILPKANLKHLALDKEVINSIKSGDFHIWSVSNVDEAIPLIMGKPFRDEDESSVISKIAERIENYEKHEHPPTIVERIKNLFVKH